ncbi:DNA-directed RNA polymerase III subunit RPC5 [Bienertia sinuspersici]
MDFDDLDDPFQSESKPSKFAPKLSKFQPKTKAGVKVQPQPKAEPKVEPPPVVVKKEDDSASLIFDSKMDVDEERETPVKNGEGIMDAVMEEQEDDDDHVVAEYDVYFTPSDPRTQLYVLQYPLRPSWRPYELEQRCTEVRVKPNSGEMEVDLLIDTDSDNYDPGFSGANIINKQTLSSSCRLPQATTYAVGMLSGKKLYVNPIHAVVQLRPSMEYLDSGGSKKKHIPNSNDALAGPSRKQSKQMDPTSVESWITLKYHSSATELAERYMRKMVTEQKDALQFLMKPYLSASHNWYDYLNSLCPGAVINKAKSAGPSRRFLLSLPLEERLKKWLLEGPSIQRFSAIKHLAPEDSDEDILQVLQKHARLVQGLWVPKTGIRYLQSQPVESLARDFALVLFSQNPVIKDSQLKDLGSHKSVGKAVLREIAVERPSCKDWKFKEPVDVSFMKLYPKVVEQQQKLWQDTEQRVLQIIAKRSKNSTRLGSSTPSDEGASRPNNVARPVSNYSMSKETREALPKVLRKLFQTHKVCSIQTIRQSLTDMAVTVSSHPKADVKAALIMDAAKGVDAPQEELQAAICEFAVNVHGVYVLKSSSEYPEYDPLRKLVIDLFLGSGPNAKLKKGEFLEAAKLRLQKEPTNSEFQKVISEFCVSKGGAWVLRSGDGVEK